AQKNIEKIFNDDFGITAEELKKVSGFKELSDGQQKLVIENLRQLKLAKIEIAAVKKQKEVDKFKGEKKKFWQLKDEWTDTKKHLLSIWRNSITKEGRVIEFKKETAEEEKTGGIDKHGTNLQSLVNEMKENGPEVEVVKEVDGKEKLEIQYIDKEKDFENLTGIEKTQVNNFNKIATKYSKMPYEWSLKTADKDNRKKFGQSKEEFEGAKTEILNLKKEKSNEQEAMLYMNQIELKLSLDQILKAHPEVEEQLLKIKNESAFRSVLKNLATTKGAFAVGGFLVRSFTMSTIGLIAAPATAGAIGGIRAWQKTKQEFREKEIMSRKGEKNISPEEQELIKQVDTINNQIKKLLPIVEDKKQCIELAKKDSKQLTEEEQKRLQKFRELEKLAEVKGEILKQRLEATREKKDFVDANDLVAKMRALKSKIDEDNPEKNHLTTIVLLGKFKRRLDYTQRKINEGLVNFGDENSRLSNVYELNQVISEALVCKHCEYDAKNEDELRKKQGQERLEKKLNELEEVKKKIEIRKQELQKTENTKEIDKQLIELDSALVDHKEAITKLKALGIHQTEDVESRIERFLDYRKDKTSEAQGKELRKKITYAVLTSAGFATAGYAIRDLVVGDGQVTERMIGKVKGAIGGIKGIIGGESILSMDAPNMNPAEMKEAILAIDKIKIDTEIEKLQESLKVAGVDVDIKNGVDPEALNKLVEASLGPKTSIKTTEATKMIDLLKQQGVIKPEDIKIDQFSELAGEDDAEVIGAGGEKEEIMPTDEIIKAEKLPEGAIIQKGEGIEHSLFRQLKADPNFDGDAGAEAHRIAIKAGYVDPETGQEIRVGTSGIDKAAYVLEKDGDGKIVGITEYIKDADGNFQGHESHQLADDFKSENFEGREHEKYEYLHDKEIDPKIPVAPVEKESIVTGGSRPHAEEVPIPVKGPALGPQEFVDQEAEKILEPLRELSVDDQAKEIQTMHEALSDKITNAREEGVKIPEEILGKEQSQVGSINPEQEAVIKEQIKIFNQVKNDPIRFERPFERASEALNKAIEIGNTERVNMHFSEAVKTQMQFNALDENATDAYIQVLKTRSGHEDLIGALKSSFGDAPTQEDLKFDMDAFAEMAKSKKLPTGTDWQPRRIWDDGRTELRTVLMRKNGSWNEIDTDADGKADWFPRKWLGFFGGKRTHFAEKEIKELLGNIKTVEPMPIAPDEISPEVGAGGGRSTANMLRERLLEQQQSGKINSEDIGAIKTEGASVSDEKLNEFENEPPKKLFETKEGQMEIDTEEDAVAGSGEKPAIVGELSETQMEHIEFFEKEIAETERLLKEYSAKYGDRPKYGIFEAKVMDEVNRDVRMMQGIKNGSVKGGYTGNMSPEDLAETRIEAIAAKTNLTTAQERIDAAFDEIDKK
ncbi:MAG: hypothetical protein ABH888_01420, partial [Patescibacteria group bacterium]